MSARQLLSPLEMSRFVARGFLRFDALVPDDINRDFLAEPIPPTPPATPLAAAYPEGSAVARMLALPRVRGAIESLLGPDPAFDHHYKHVNRPASPEVLASGGPVSQPLHQDSTIDPLCGFDVQLMYYPHDVTMAMGPTRLVPGTHLRLVNELALARYQNLRGQQHVVCAAGTLLFLHHGLWHGGGVNRSAEPRTMFKIRMSPTVRQVRRFDVSDFDDRPLRRATFVARPDEPESVESNLLGWEPWFESDTGQLEWMARIRLWRHLIGRPDWDVDHWQRRLENPARR
jgi:hypothetical protein